MQDELDKGLQSLFQDQSQNLPEEPFLSNTLRRIKKHRPLSRVFQPNLIPIVAVVCCALSSRFLIKGSILLSGYLDWGFGAAGMFLNKPEVTMAGALCCALLLLIFRRGLFSTRLLNNLD